jgi:hypothetical protein
MDAERRKEPRMKYVDESLCNERHKEPFASERWVTTIAAKVDRHDRQIAMLAVLQILLPFLGALAGALIGAWIK